MDWKEALDALGKLRPADQEEGTKLAQALASGGRFGEVPAWYSMLKIARALNCQPWDIEETVYSNVFESGIVEEPLEQLSRVEWIRKGVIAMVAEQQAQNVLVQVASGPLPGMNGPRRT
jgi:hypothetical protein